MANTRPPQSGLGPMGTEVEEFMANPLEVFRKPHTDTSITLNSLNDDPRVIEFNIPPYSDYLQLDKLRLCGQLEVQKTASGTWTAIVDGDDVSCVQLLPGAMFNQCSVELNGTEICDLGSYTAAYKMFLENTFSFSGESRSTFLKPSAMFFPDIAGKSDTKTKNPGTEVKNNTHFDQRKKLLVKKPLFDISIPCDLFHSPQLLLPGIGIHIKLTRSDNQFCLLAPDANVNYRIVIKDLYLKARCVTVNPNISESHVKVLESNHPAIYSYPYGKITTHIITPNLSSTIVPEIAKNILPQLVLVGFVDGGAFSSDITKNPFEFKSVNISSLHFDVDGTSFPARPYEPDFSTDNGNGALREYNDLVEALQLNENYPIPITYQEFTSNLCFFALDTSGHYCNRQHRHVRKIGTINLHISFKTNNTNPIQAIVYSVYNRTLYIDKFKKVIVDSYP